jgi:hypothetical protein
VSNGRQAGPDRQPPTELGVTGTAPVSITTARAPLSDDLARRQRRYLVQMGVRVVCFGAGALVWGHLPLIVPIVLMVAATVLPYIAVLAANAAHERSGRTMTLAQTRALEAATHEEVTR